MKAVHTFWIVNDDTHLANSILIVTSQNLAKQYIYHRLNVIVMCFLDKYLRLNVIVMCFLDKYLRFNVIVMCFLDKYLRFNVIVMCFLAKYLRLNVIVMCFLDKLPSLKLHVFRLNWIQHFLHYNFKKSNQVVSTIW